MRVTNWKGSQEWHGKITPQTYRSSCLSRPMQHSPKRNGAAHLSGFGADLRPRHRQQRIQRTLPNNLILPRAVWGLHKLLQNLRFSDSWGVYWQKTRLQKLWLCFAKAEEKDRRQWVYSALQQCWGRKRIGNIRFFDIWVPRIKVWYIERSAKGGQTVRTDQKRICFGLARRGRVHYSSNFHWKRTKRSSRDKNRLKR